MLYYIILPISALCLDVVTIYGPRSKFIPCEDPMVLSNAISWTGAPKSFKDYHFAEKREYQTVTSYSGFFKEHIFAKEKETYWFGPKERVSDILECDIRYNCTLRTSSDVIRSLFSTSSYKYTYDEWKEITQPNPPHPEALAEIVALFKSNKLPVTEKAPRYIWLTPIYWGIKGTYTVKYKFGFNVYSTSEEMEVYFPLKAPSGQIDGMYGLGKAYKMFGDWHLH